MHTQRQGDAPAQVVLPGGRQPMQTGLHWVGVTHVGNKPSFFKIIMIFIMILVVETFKMTDNSQGQFVVIA